MGDSIFGLESRGALVLGGGQGMGEATALALAGAGCRVAVFDFEFERAERVVARIHAEGGRALAVQGDALNGDSLRQAIARAHDGLGGISIMASIIGMAAWSSLTEMTEEIWDLDQGRNLRYFFIAAQAVAKLMIASGEPGSIVSIGSVDGVRSAPFHASYGAAKAGLIHLVQTMAYEWASHGIRVNCVTPGSIVSPRVPRDDPERERSLTAGIPMGSRGTADDIANAALFLLSDMARYVTGQNLAIDGGLLTRSLFDYSQRMAEVPSGGTMGMSNLAV